MSIYVTPVCHSTLLEAEITRTADESFCLSPVNYSTDDVLADGSMRISGLSNITHVADCYCYCLQLPSLSTSSSPQPCSVREAIRGRVRDFLGNHEVSMLDFVGPTSHLKQQTSDQTEYSVSSLPSTPVGSTRFMFDTLEPLGPRPDADGKEASPMTSSCHRKSRDEYQTPPPPPPQEGDSLSTDVTASASRTFNSDCTAFMQAPLCHNVPVSSRLTTSRKRALVRKLSKFRKKVQSVGWNQLDTLVVV